MSYYSSMVDYVEIYENERTWIGGGFSKKGLLPNDRGRYSTLDGSLSFKTIEEAQEAMLLPGFAYLEQSAFVHAEDDGDPPWYYARDFSKTALSHKQTTKGPLSWVRFRRLVRPKRLDPLSLFVGTTTGDASTSTAAKEQRLTATLQKCSSGDSVVTQQISQTLVEVTAYLTLLHNASACTIAAVLQAKQKVLQVLQGQYAITTRTTSTKTPSERFAALRHALEQLANIERDKPQHLLSKVEFFNNRQAHSNWNARCQELVAHHYTERTVLAGWMMRLLDEPEFQFHCNQTDCHGPSCQFFPVSCPNEGCVAAISQKYLSDHDAVCDYKVSPCSCGDLIRRGDRARHNAEECPMRRTQCPFDKIGCQHVGEAHEIPEHLETHVASHLSLALNRMMEFQNVVRDLNSKVSALQQENQQLHRTLQAHRDAAVKETKEISRKVTDVGKKLNNLETSSRKEFKRIRDHSRERAKALNGGTG